LWELCATSGWQRSRVRQHSRYRILSVSWIRRVLRMFFVGKVSRFMRQSTRRGIRPFHIGSFRCDRLLNAWLLPVHAVIGHECVFFCAYLAGAASFFGCYCFRTQHTHMVPRLGSAPRAFELHQYVPNSLPMLQRHPEFIASNPNSIVLMHEVVCDYARACVRKNITRTCPHRNSACMASVWAKLTRWNVPATAS
jgi:hypothetical protein